MIKILNKQTQEVFIIHNALKSEATKDSFINYTPITMETIRNWHGIFDYRQLISKVGNKATFQFLLKDHFEVII